MNEAVDTAPNPLQAEDTSLRWGDACAAAAIALVAPERIGGIRLRARHGPTRTRWLERFRQLAGDVPWQRLSAGADDATLFGGLDIAASLAAGRAVMTRGVLERARGGWVILGSAERCEPALAARLAGVLDGGDTAGLALLALDEGTADEDLVAPLSERLTLHVEPGEQPRELRDAEWPLDAAAIAVARRRLDRAGADDDCLLPVCETADALGIVSLRAPISAYWVARVAAALDARDRVTAEDLSLAARLVLGPRARQHPSAASDIQDADASTSETATNPREEAFSSEAATTDTTDSADDDASAAKPRAPTDTREPAGHDAAHADTQTEARAAEETAGETADAPAGDYGEIMLDAARAALPDGLLDLSIGEWHTARPTGPGGGRRGPGQAAGRRGRPAGTRPGMPGPQQRLDVMATLRAAVPWQRLRGRSAESPRLRIRVEDFRVRRYVQPQESATLFVVDASGSAALHRLAETKGAVELLLADCYVRRDRVGLIAFRGTTAETLLCPTRSLTRAKRTLAGLPGGGPTPLASALSTVEEQARRAAADGLRPLIVLLTDGRGNIALDGQADRRRAAADTESAAARLRAMAYQSLVIDTSPRPREAARRLAEQLGGRYLGLPQANAGQLSDAVRAVSA